MASEMNELIFQLKRIADSLEKITCIPEINAIIEQVENQEPFTSDSTEKKGNHQDIVDAWNNELVPLGIPKINSIRSKRATMVTARIKEYGKDSFFKCIEEVKQSSFLQGKTKKPWTNFNFDWLICPNNFPKVLEGNYNDNRKREWSDPTVTTNALPESWAR